jgi:hypothetical protein
MRIDNHRSEWLSVVLENDMDDLKREMDRLEAAGDVLENVIDEATRYNDPWLSSLKAAIKTLRAALDVVDEKHQRAREDYYRREGIGEHD